MVSSCNIDGQIQIGNRVRTRGTFTDAITELPLDPASVFVTITQPDGSTDTYELGSSAIVKEDIGIYYFDFDLDQYGTWLVKWHSVSPATTTEVGFRVLSTVS